MRIKYPSIGSLVETSAAEIIRIAARAICAAVGIESRWPQLRPPHFAHPELVSGIVSELDFPGRFIS